MAMQTTSTCLGNLATTDSRMLPCCSIGVRKWQKLLVSMPVNVTIVQLAHPPPGWVLEDYEPG